LFLNEGLISIGFQQSQHDPCIYWRKTVTIIFYTEDTIVTGSDEVLLNKAATNIGAKFEITAKNASVDAFLGVKTIRDDVTGTVELVQPQLIDLIPSDLNLDKQSNQQILPVLSSKILHCLQDSENRSEEWHYCAVIGRMEKVSRPDLANTVHHCARFSEEPKDEHTMAVKLIF
jgi:hypothetical protein